MIIRNPFRNRTRRGHGVHPPFAYQLMREVFMNKLFIGGDRTLYNELTGIGVSTKAALQLQNLYDYCGCKGFTVGNANTGTEFVVVAKPEHDLIRISPGAGNGGNGVTCFICLEGRRERRELKERIAEIHEGLSIEGDGYILLFHRKGLTKNHIKI